MNLIGKIEKIRKLYFPEIDDFRDKQFDAITNVLSGRNTLCLMATGKGKSLVYYISGLCMEKCTIVISPLIALMSQQMAKLKNQGLQCLALNSEFSPKEQYEELRTMVNRQMPDFLFLSPEKASFDGLLEFTLRHHHKEIGLIVIDEAHCVSQWGHTFRPMYKTIPEFLNRVFGQNGWPTILCLTATLSVKDQQEIRSDFRISEKDIVRGESLLRLDLDLKFVLVDNEKEKTPELQKELSRHKDEKVLVYTHRKESEYGTQAMSERFQADGYQCDYFDADRTKSDKDRVLQGFLQGSIKVVFATSAFGMGIDIPDIRACIHFLIPESIEQYYQEIGRAGRDGTGGDCVCFYSDTNIRFRRTQIKSTIPKADFIKYTFNNKIRTSPTSKIQSIMPFQDINSDDKEFLLYNYFINKGLISIEAKGIRLLNCFTGSNGHSTILNKYLQHNPQGLVVTIARKSSLNIQEIIDDVYGMYTEGKTDLYKSPTNSVFYRTADDISDHQTETIRAEIEERVNYRLEGLDKFTNVITSKGDYQKMIAKHLGIPHI